MTAHRRMAATTLSLIVIALSLQAQDTTAIRQTAGGILIDFQDVDLRTVITALAEVGGLNVSYGDIPTRRTTLRLHQPIAKGDVLPLLKSVAATNGLQLIQEDQVIRLQPDDSRNSATGQQKSVAVPESRLFVYRLRHARAAKIASTLQAIFGSPTSQSQALAGMPPRIGSQSPALAGDSAKTASRTTSVVSIVATLHAPVQIVSDEATNALVIHAIETDYDVVRQAIEALDLRPRQVLIEMLIAEVRQSSELDLGIAARATRDDDPAARRGGGGPIASSSTADLILRLTSNATFDINVALHALQSRGDVRIISRPVLLAQNNQEAKILVGSQRPFVQVFRSLPTEAAVRDQVVQYKDVGTSLTILPAINADGYVDLQLAQEVSTATTEVQFGAPVISTRETSTHLLVRNGQTAVIGGLVDRTQESSRAGLPFLTAIPLAGHLFGSAVAGRATTELFLFLTPHIIETDSDVDRLRDDVERQSKWLRDEKPKPIQLPPSPPVRPPSW